MASSIYQELISPLKALAGCLLRWLPESGKWTEKVIWGGDEAQPSVGCWRAGWPVVKTRSPALVVGEPGGRL